MAGKKVLVVDDNASVVRFVAGVLRPLGYQVLTAADGIAALKLIGMAKPDLVLLDLVMPRLNGYQLLQVVEKKKLSPHSTFVLMSSTKERVVDRVRQLTGVAHTLAKPVTAQQLRELVQNLLPLAGEPAPAGAGEDENEFTLDLEEPVPPPPQQQPPAEAPATEAESLATGEAFSGETTSDDAVRTRRDLVGLLRDRLDSAVAAGLAERLDDIMAAQDRDVLLGLLAEVLAAVVNDRLVERMLELAASHADPADD